MKVATLNDGTPDGRLVAVSDDLTTQRACTEPTLQAALDSDRLVPAYEERPFAPALCAAPLPRAYQFLDGSAYVNHVALVRQARGAAMPGRFWTDPLMYQGASDGCLGPTEDIVADPAWGPDFEAEIAVITGYVPQGANRDQAAASIRYVMLCNDISLRALIPDELAKGFGFVQSKPASAFSPVAVAVDACPGWRDGRLHGTLSVDLNGAPFGRVEAGEDMTFGFPALIAHAARTRSLAPGTIVGSGTVSNRGADGGPGAPVADGGRGYACIAEQRMVETILTGAPRTPFLSPGDRVRIWMDDAEGRSIFGTLDQEVRAP
ncbi:fumarylacetoacetate (FAA) hydrolase [Rhodovulum iodosum]|uniref:Fumarylacetoacetate (FAA) hydrolase n=1 Tax=Rhodovulum iodosum TaxID=68291 RepID=A0ABV3XUM9_9RHOB|nr:fumarylacetoacetate hydrolase family protein [Rhodovulum robiginosum]RSK35091.1 FAA hydrolase family protein [Rhodovulum robiginosum]